jgi:hypothetical protein
MRVQLLHLIEQLLAELRGFLQPIEVPVKVATRNVADFERTGIGVLNPWEA